MPLQAAEGAASWAQHMLSALVKLLEQMTGHERLVLTVYGTTKVTAADFTHIRHPQRQDSPTLPLGLIPTLHSHGLSCPTAPVRSLNDHFAWVAFVEDKSVSVTMSVAPNLCCTPDSLELCATKR